MAEGWLRALGRDRFEVHSAGTEATHVRPLAIQVMAEVDISISGQRSKTLERYLGESFDAVITVCDDANETCPVFPGAKRCLHWSFPDPSQATGSADAQREAYRDVRDAILQRIQTEFLAETSSARDRNLGGDGVT
jgi:arsenate reductase